MRATNKNNSFLAFEVFFLPCFNFKAFFFAYNIEIQCKRCGFGIQMTAKTNGQSMLCYVVVCVSCADYMLNSKIAAVCQKTRQGKQKKRQFINV